MSCESDVTFGEEPGYAHFLKTLLAVSLRCMTWVTASAADSVDAAPNCRGSAFGPLLAACQSHADARPSFASTQLLAGMARTAFELGEPGDCTCIAPLLLLLLSIRQVHD